MDERIEGMEGWRVVIFNRVGRNASKLSSRRVEEGCLKWMAVGR